MQRSFSYSLLITLIFLFGNCNTQYIKTSSETRNLMVTDSAMPVDSQFVSLYLPYKMKLKDNISRVISISKEEMVKDKPESNLTNFLADILLEEGTRIAMEKGYNLKPDLSFYNYGGIRTFLPEGEITVEKIYELMPFENEMVILQLTGKQVREFLNIIAAGGGDSVGGVRFTISGKLATGITVGQQKLEPERLYWLVTNDYVASGGDGLEVLTRSKDMKKTELKIRDAIIAHLERMHQKNEKIYVVPDGRITYNSTGRDN